MLQMSDYCFYLRWPLTLFTLNCFMIVSASYNVYFRLDCLMIVSASDDWSVSGFEYLWQFEIWHWPFVCQVPILWFPLQITVSASDVYVAVFCFGCLYDSFLLEMCLWLFCFICLCCCFLFQMSMCQFSAERFCRIVNCFRCLCYCFCFNCLFDCFLFQMSTWLFSASNICIAM